MQRAAYLLSQQLWCWGRDIESAYGNLLIEHGCQRIAAPDDSNAASIYRCDPSPSSRVILRGFGIFFGDDRLGGVYVHRYDFAPQLTPKADLEELIWMPRDLPCLRSPESDQEISIACQLLVALCDWIRGYEVATSESYGIAYREDSLKGWNPKDEIVVPAQSIASSWRLIGSEIANNPRQFVSSA